MNSIKYPELRAEVIGAIKALADPPYQRTVWLDPREFDGLTLNANILFDDAQVLPDPSQSLGTVGAVVREEEVPALRRLGRAFREILERLGESSDAAYLDDPAWPEVVEAARAVLREMGTT